MCRGETFKMVQEQMGSSWPPCTHLQWQALGSHPPKFLTVFKATLYPYTSHFNTLPWNTLSKAQSENGFFFPCNGSEPTSDGRAERMRPKSLIQNNHWAASKHYSNVSIKYKRCVCPNTRASKTWLVVEVWEKTVVLLEIVSKMARGNTARK